MVFKQMKNLIQKRVLKEDKVIKDSMKGAFVRIIKNCIFKSKLNHFLERTKQRLVEKAFDKMKENNWVVEDRKEALEAIICK